MLLSCCLLFARLPLCCHFNLSGYEYCRIDGNTPHDVRQDLIEEYNSRVCMYVACMMSNVLLPYRCCCLLLLLVRYDRRYLHHPLETFLHDTAVRCLAGLDCSRRAQRSSCSCSPRERAVSVSTFRVPTRVSSTIAIGTLRRVQYEPLSMHCCSLCCD